MAARGPADQWEQRFTDALRLRRVGKLYALAVAIGVDESAISRWKKGRSITLENAAQVCRTLDISLDWLVMGRGSIDGHRQAPPERSEFIRQAFPEMTPNQAEAVTTALHDLVHALGSEHGSSCAPRKSLRRPQGNFLSKGVLLSEAIYAGGNGPAAGVLAPKLRTRTSPMGSPYEIDITMPQATVDALKNGGFALYAFKAVKSAVAGGAPLVWFRTTTFLTGMQVTWTEDYQAYISSDEIISNGRISAQAYADIDLGNTANVSPTGGVVAVNGGTDGAVSILNQGATPWTCGISQLNNGAANPMCAIPLYGKMLDVIIPIEKVLLMFASNTVNTGTVIYKAYSEGVLVDLTDPTAKGKRSVAFDINQGWSWGGGATRFTASIEVWAGRLQPPRPQP